MSMNVRIRKENKDGIVRLESSGVVKEVLVKEDLLYPKEELVSVCFRGENSSGIIDFTPEEIEELYLSVKDKIHLVKGFKVLKGKW